MAISRFDVYVVALDPTIGSEMKKSRPCVVVSPNAMNRFLRTIIIAPLTTRGRPYPSRVDCSFQGRLGQIVLDQIRTVDRSRLIRRLGRLGGKSARQIAAVLQEMFAP